MWLLIADFKFNLQTTCFNSSLDLKYGKIKYYPTKTVSNLSFEFLLLKLMISHGGSNSTLVLWPRWSNHSRPFGLAHLTAETELVIPLHFCKARFCCFTLAINITFLMQPHHLCYHSLRYHENTISVALPCSQDRDTDLNKRKKKNCPFTDVALSSIIHQIRGEILLRCTSDLTRHLWRSGPNKAQQSMCSAFPIDISRLRYTLLDNKNTSHHNRIELL